MKRERERVTDFGELIKSFSRPSQENVNNDDIGKKDIVLGDIDAKVFKEAFKNIDLLEAKLEKVPQKEKKARKVNEAQVNIANKQVQIQRPIPNQQYNEQSRDFGREDL